MPFRLSSPSIFVLSSFCVSSMNCLGVVVFSDTSVGVHIVAPPLLGFLLALNFYVKGIYLIIKFVMISCSTFHSISTQCLLEIQDATY